MAVLPALVTEAQDTDRDLSAGLIDLCAVLARPTLYLAPSLIRPYLAAIGLDLTEDDPDLPDEGVDEVFFDQLMIRLNALPEDDWSIALGLSRDASVIPLIATAPHGVITHFAISAAAACLHVPIGLNVLKQKINRISDILGPDAAKIAFGEAQFLYQALGQLDEAPEIYDAIFRSDAESEQVHAQLVNFGQSIIYSTLKMESRLWAEIFSFRTGPAGFQRSFDARQFSTQNRNLILRLWERKWKKWQNS